MGKWAEECARAAKRNYVAESLAKAVDVMIDVIRGRPMSEDSILIAGNTVRNHRKALGVVSMKVSDVSLSDTPYDLLMWAAIREVAAAKVKEKTGTEADAVAFHLREAEAYLRTHWKISQEAGRTVERLRRRGFRPTVGPPTTTTTRTSHITYTNDYGAGWGYYSG